MVAGTIDKATVGSSVSTCIGDEKRCKRILLWKVQLSFYIFFYIQRCDEEESCI